MEWAALKDWGFTIGSLLALVSFVRLLLQDVEARRARLSVKTTDAAGRGLWVEIVYRPPSKHAASVASVKLLDDSEGELWGGDEPIAPGESKRTVSVRLKPSDENENERIGSVQVMPRVREMVSEAWRDGSYSVFDIRRISSARVEVKITVTGRCVARRRLTLSAID